MADRIVDARGSFCPGPMMELIKTVKQVQVGETVTVLTQDPGSKRDIPLWVQKAGHEYVGLVQMDGYEEITVRKLR